MPDVKTKPLVTIDKVRVTKSWNPVAAKTATAAAEKALLKMLKGAGGLDYTKTIKKKDKGLGVSLTFVDITYDPKKRSLVLKLEVLVSKYPGPKLATTGGSPAKIEATKIEEKAAIKEAPYLAADLVTAKKSKLLKILATLGQSL